ncbi:esterase-like activity of phytase family protein, partial [Staphylococcus arlettae]
AEDNSYTNHVKVYKYSTENATNIKNMSSLKNHKVQPLKKQLVTSLNKTDLKHIDNVEGITFGKKLPNGHDTLVLVADNNFNKEQQTQIIAFEVLP